MCGQFEENAAAYYSGKLLAHGPSPAGVDWNSAESQQLRFAQLLKICPSQGEYSLLDYGCGYGALLAYIQTGPHRPRYYGYDVAETMIIEACTLHGEPHRSCFFSRWAEVPPVDFTVASGVFNVKQQAHVDQWKDYVIRSLEKISSISKRGLAFNLLTSYSDPHRMRDDLFYADPWWFFDYCKTRFSRHVALLHDYGLYEFTILVRKD